MIGWMLILFGFPVPIIFALLLHEAHFNTMKRVFQACFYLPHFFGLVIVGQLFYSSLSPTFGLVNEIINAFNGT